MQEKFDRLTTGELNEINDLIHKGEKEDAWIKLGMSPKDFESERDNRQRSFFINSIINTLLE